MLRHLPTYVDLPGIPVGIGCLLSLTCVVDHLEAMRSVSTVRSGTVDPFTTAELVSCVTPLVLGFVGGILVWSARRWLA